jgi:peptidoglycan/LPS O-acetylase OafA/YrhL
VPYNPCRPLVPRDVDPTAAINWLSRNCCREFRPFDGKYRQIIFTLCGLFIMRRLSDYTAGRKNNFNVMRLVAASAVLVSHGFVLSTGNQQLEPFVREFGMTLGSIAVGVFFVTSGFLVTGSLLSRNNIVEFSTARALRIYPALWVSQILTVLIVGLWFTSEKPSFFFSQWVTWHSFLKNCVLIRYIDFTFPGAFESVPFVNGGVNSSLWTLPIELRMYLCLGLGWIALRLSGKLGNRLFIVGCAGAAFVGISGEMIHYIVPAEQGVGVDAYWSLGGLFFAGATFRLLQSKIPVSKAIAIFLAAVLVASMCDKFVFGLVYRITIAYLVVYLALVPSFRGYHYSPRGDYSYGIYIYAYPVQQAIATLIKGISPYQMIALSGLITFSFAFLSWHCIEKHALRFKEALVTKEPKAFAPNPLM